MNSLLPFCCIFSGKMLPLTPFHGLELFSHNLHFFGLGDVVEPSSLILVLSGPFSLSFLRDALGRQCHPFPHSAHCCLDHSLISPRFCLLCLGLHLTLVLPQPLIGPLLDQLLQLDHNLIFKSFSLLPSAPFLPSSFF